MRLERPHPISASPPQAAYASATQRIPTLDGWRGIAILLVLVSHIGIVLGHSTGSIGQHGVAIFFVLSGFLITSRLLREHQTHGSIDLKHFYIRRFFRLMPAAWTYLAVRGALFLLSGHGISTLELPACLFFFRNFVDLSGAHARTAGHFWSLSIEEQFYLLWPSLLVLVGIRRARWVALLVAFSIASWRFLHLGELTRLPLQATFATQYRADGLLLGCAAALFLPCLRPYVRRWMLLPLLGALVACLSFDRGLIPLYESGLIALLLVATSDLPTSALGRILDWKPLTFVGVISYSLYLWQQVMLGAQTARELYTCLPALLAIAVASYYFIESPLIEKARALCSRSAARAARPVEVVAATR